MPLVDLFVPGSALNSSIPRLHVVPGDAFAVGDRLQIHLVDDLFVSVIACSGDVDAQIPLRLQHCDPMVPFEARSGARRPDRGQVGGGMPEGQDVGDGRFRHSASL